MSLLPACREAGRGFPPSVVYPNDKWGDEIGADQQVHRNQSGGYGIGDKKAERGGPGDRLGWESECREKYRIQ